MSVAYFMPDQDRCTITCCSVTLKAVMFQKIIRLLAALCLLVSGVVHADEEFLDPAVAFKFSARMVDGKTAAVTFDIADGYYMYRERFAFKANGATLGQPDIPP